MVVWMFLVPEEGLDGVQARARFDEVGGEAVAQGVGGGLGQAQFLARHDDEALEGADGHGRVGFMHALGESVRIVGAASGVREEKLWVAVEGPSSGAGLEHGGSQRDHAVAVPALAPAYPELAARPINVAHGEVEASERRRPAQ